jgi:hypothetical protein
MATHAGGPITVKHFVMPEGFAKVRGDLSSLHQVHRRAALER